MIPLRCRDQAKGLGRPRDPFAPGAPGPTGRPLERRPLGAYGGGRAGGALVGCGFFGRRSRASGRRMDCCCQAAAALVQRGSQHHQRPGGQWCCRPVGDDARAAGGGRLRCRNGPGAQAGRRTRTAHPDRWRYGRRTGRGEPRTCGERFSGACVLGDDRLHSPDSLAAGRPEAWIFGAGRSSPLPTSTRPARRSPSWSRSASTSASARRSTRDGSRSGSCYGWPPISQGVA
jgi:hypothetical protein